MKSFSCKKPNYYVSMINSPYDTNGSSSQNVRVQNPSNSNSQNPYADSQSSASHRNLFQKRVHFNTNTESFQSNDRVEPNLYNKGY